jgi:heptosyltransferase-2
MRGCAASGRVIENPFAHGELALAGARALGRELRDEAIRARVRAAELVEVRARAVSRAHPAAHRVHRRGALGLLNDARALDRKALPRLVESLRGAGGRAAHAHSHAACTGARARTREPRGRHARAAPARRPPVAVLCPGAEFGPRSAGRPNYFADLGAQFLRDGMQVWIVGSPNDKLAARAVMQSAGEPGPKFPRPHRPHRPRTAIDLLAVASRGRQQRLGPDARRRRGRLHRWWRCSDRRRRSTRAAVTAAQVAKIDSNAAPCFKRECPLGHFKSCAISAPASSTISRASRCPSARRREN